MQKNVTIVIATHYLVYGAVQALRDFINQQKFSSLLYIQSPLLDQQESYVVNYTKGKLLTEKIIKRKKTFLILQFLGDIQIVFTQIFWKKNKTDIFIGADSLNCIVGLLLRKLGKTKKVIFYSIDFVPIRFPNKMLNALYHAIENFCVKHANEVWNVSPRIAEGREEFFHISQREFPQKIVPVGIWKTNIKKRPFGKIKKHQLLFVGHLLEKQGVQVVLQAIPSIIKKIPDFHFVIIGGGEYQKMLEQIVQDLHITAYVTFVGWITERTILDDCLSESAIAIATYKPEKERLYNFTYYADPTKLKDYLGAGLPIILTDLSYNAREIAEKECGILVEYDKHAIATAIINLLSDEKILKKYRKNAEKYAEAFDWTMIFTPLFE